jgi:hypothetical protein
VVGGNHFAFFRAYSWYDGGWSNLDIFPDLANSEWEGYTVRRLLVTAGLALVIAASCWAAGKASKDSPAAAKTRKKLKQKLSVEFSETPLRDAMDALKREFDNKLSFKFVDGISKNQPITYSAKDKPLEEILDKMLTKLRLGYVVISAPKASDRNNRIDGWIMIKRGKERGYAIGEEPGKDKQAKDTGDEDNPPKDKKKKDKKGKDKKSTDKKKDGEDNKKDKEQADPDKEEKDAAAKLKLAKMFESDGLKKSAITRYKDIIKQFPNTEAAKEARARLKKLEK